MGKWESGRIETILAAVVLVVMAALFFKLNAIDEPTVPDPSIPTQRVDVSTHADGAPTGTAATTTTAEN